MMWAYERILNIIIVKSFYKLFLNVFNFAYVLFQGDTGIPGMPGYAGPPGPKVNIILFLQHSINFIHYS